MADRFLVIGGGTMGSGIALTAARGGYDVEIVEPDAAARARSAEYLERETQRAGDRRRSTISGGATRSRSYSASIAIEAVPERFDLKSRIFAELAAALGPDALARDEYFVALGCAISPTSCRIPSASSACISSIRRRA